MSVAAGTRRITSWIAMLALAACGYSSGSITQRDHRRIHLPLFVNETFYRDLEVELTRQVAKELASRPGISLVPLEQAEVVLVGTIVGFEQRVLSEDAQDQVRESSAMTRVRIEVRDARTGVVARTFSVRDRAEFLAARGGALGAATSESFFDVARRVVDGLESDFPRASASGSSLSRGDLTDRP